MYIYPKMHSLARPGEMHGEALSTDMTFIEYQDCFQSLPSRLIQININFMVQNCSILQPLCVSYKVDIAFYESRSW